MVGEKVLSRETHRHSETLRTFANEHHMARVFHHSLADLRNILDVAYAADRAGPPRRTMHAAGVEFNHPFFIRQPAQTYAGVVGIVLGTLDHSQSSIQRVSATGQKGKGIVKIVVSIVGTNNDGALAWRVRTLCVTLFIQQSQRERTGDSSRKKIAARDGHIFSRS